MSIENRQNGKYIDMQILTSALFYSLCEANTSHMHLRVILCIYIMFGTREIVRLSTGIFRKYPSQT
jgi:hypothetical protein